MGDLSAPCLPYTCHTKQVTLNSMKSRLPPRNPRSSQGDLSLDTVFSLLWEFVQYFSF